MAAVSLVSGPVTVLPTVLTAPTRLRPSAGQGWRMQFMSLAFTKRNFRPEELITTTEAVREIVKEKESVAPVPAGG